MPLCMETFIGYARQFRPGFSTEIAGASFDEIAQLAQLTQVDLTADYVAFLSTMGRSDGGLGLGLDGSADIRSVLEHLRACQDASVIDIPPNCVPLSTGYLGELFVEVGSVNALRVVQAEGAEIVGVFADSLEHLLYRTAFSEFAMRRRWFSTALAGSYAEVGYRRVLPAAEHLADSLGFTREWFSDSQVICCHSPSGLMTLAQYEGQGLGIILATDSPWELFRVRTAFRRAIRRRFGRI